jgi:hypothetical protein
MVSGKIHAQAALTLAKKPLLPFELQDVSGSIVEEQSSLSLSGIMITRLSSLQFICNNR